MPAAITNLATLAIDTSVPVSGGTIPNVTVVTAGSTLRVTFGLDGNTLGGINSATWGAHNLVASTDSNSGAECVVWEFYNAPAETNDVVFTTSLTDTSWLMASADEVSGVTAAPLDVQGIANSAIAGTSPSVTGTSPPVQNDEIYVAAATESLTTGAGAWDNGFTRLVRITTDLGTNSLDLAWKLINDGSAQTASKSGEISDSWGAIIDTYKSAGAAASIVDPIGTSGVVPFPR